MSSRTGNILGAFASHPTAANLLMVLMLVVGLISLGRLNTQFFPDFGIDIITVSITWSGASAEDVESNIIKALEPELRFLDGVDKVISSAREGSGTVALEYQSGTDMQAALAAVESAVSQIVTFPADVAAPVIAQVIRYDTISRLILSGPYREAALKHMAKRIRDDLLALGIDKVSIFPIRDEEIHVEVTPETLLALNMTLSDIAAQIRASNQDLPSGDTGGKTRQQLRGIGLMQTVNELSSINVRAYEGGEKIVLRDIADVRDTFDPTAPTILLNDEPAIELHIQRAVGADALVLADRVDEYLNTLRPTFPPNLNVQQFDVAANLIRERINLLLRNGAGGLVLVLGILFLFLNSHVALWIAVGIPTAVLGALAAMLVTGQSINMVSLFALIMMIGIVVDDAIVVGEHAMAKRAEGLGAAEAAVSGAHRMLAPVFSASLTTIAAFVPVMMISGIIGEIIMAIPLVVVAVLIASLIECFLILPGHMRGALTRNLEGTSRFRRHFNTSYEAFRDGLFRRFVEFCVRWRYATLSGMVASLIVAIGLVAGGRVQFVFFPSPESDIIYANFTFSPGTTRARTDEMVSELARALDVAENALVGDGKRVVRVALGSVAAPASSFGRRNSGDGDHLGGMTVELTRSENRDVRTADMITAWRAEIRQLSGLETLTIRARQGGPPGRDLDIRLYGGETAALKQAALETRDLIRRFNGVTDITDNLPWGKQELIFSVNERGRMLGFTTETVSRQVREAFDGTIAQRFIRNDEEVAVRVQLPRNATSPATLRRLYLRAPEGKEVPLLQVVDLESDRGFALIRRENGIREVSVTAEIEESVVNPTELVAALEADGLPNIAKRHGVEFRFAGKAEEQGETLADMRIGALVGLTMIYIVLAWVFGSYTRPLVVMSIIPFAVVGAIIGHWLLGFDLTILSLIGLLGLSGIVVNDSIILVTAIDERFARNESLHTAIIDGARDRLRPVVLTSLTTIGGLLPLLAETSLQAQFLKPMALTIVFGLMATTILVLVVVPALIAIQADFRLKSASFSPKAGDE